MSDYQHKSGAQWAPVPDAAHPDDDGGQARVVYPPLTDRDPNNVPCGGFGEPYGLITASQMSGVGWNWYMAFFPDERAELVAVKFRLFNERRGAWVYYAGNLCRPQAQSCKPAASAARTMYSGVSIIIQDLQETA